MLQLNIPKVLPLPPKLRFHQAAASAAKLIATAVLPPPPLLPLSHCHRRATAAYKIKEKYVILLTNLFFHHDGNGSKQQWRWTHKKTTIAVLLFATI
jgi:hypothetical protein